MIKPTYPEPRRLIAEEDAMPKGTKVAQVEAKLKAEYGSSPAAAGKVYGTLNKVGLMRGNQPTKKGLQKASRLR